MTWWKLNLQGRPLWKDMKDSSSDKEVSWRMKTNDNKKRLHYGQSWQVWCINDPHQIQLEKAGHQQCEKQNTQQDKQLKPWENIESQGVRSVFFKDLVKILLLNNDFNRPLQLLLDFSRFFTVIVGGRKCWKRKNKNFALSVLHKK